MSFYSIHVHDVASNALFLDALSKPKDLIKRAVELNYSGLCITNHATVSSYIDYLKERDKLKKAGSNFKIMFGIEAYLIDEADYKNTRDFYHAVIVAKDLIGLRQIFSLSSSSWDRSYFERGVRRVPVFYQDIEAFEEKGHLIFSSACLGSRLSKLILAHDVQGTRDFLSWTTRTFGRENVFLEMQPNDHSPEQKIVNDTILKLSRQTGIPYIITSDSHYTLKSDAPIHQAFLNSREAKGVRETSPFYDYTYLLALDEFYEVMGNMGMTEEEVRVGLENTKLLADKVEEFDFRHSTIIPQIKIPEFFVGGLFEPWYDKFPFIKKFATDDERQNRYMMYCMEQRIKEKRYKFTEAEAERINIELEVLNGLSEYHRQPMSAYLNLVKRIIDIIWQVCPVMPGRGSCSGFLSCYYLGITQLNPLDYNLPWFRFLNLGRVDDFPDIDIDVDASHEDQIIELLKKEFGEDCVLHTLTFKTESLKSAILTACRGFDINNDEAQEMSALVPMKRGKMPSLEGVEKGDVEIDTPPVPQLIEKIRRHGGLYEAIERIQGVCSGIGIHASSLYIFQNGYLAQNALMKAPNNAEITAFNMHDSDAMGALKFDLLKTMPPQLFGKVMEYMLKDGVIEWQGSLRGTWDKYLHPSNVNYNDPTLWQNAAEGKVLQLFQFGDSVSGSVTIRKIRPTSLVEMALANDVMRLQGTFNGETPTDRFVRYKFHPDEALKEMKEAGLNDEEISIVKDHFGESYGVTCEQEQLMGALLDERICGFPLRTVNKCRKILAKKLTDQIPQMKEDFYSECEKHGTRKVFADYVWDMLLLPQLSYSFSRNHSVAYSAIGTIEAMLVTDYNPLYWDAAVLSVQAGGEAQNSQTMEEFVFGDETEEAAEQAGGEDESKKISAPNYGKIARGISLVQNHGVKIVPPYINEASINFAPIVKENVIMFGLGGVTGVNPDLANRIIEARPFVSLVDFLTRIGPTNVQAINLVKAGCFDEMYPANASRKEIMEEYVRWTVKQKVTLKDKLTMANLEKAIDMGIVPLGLDFGRRVWRYKKWLTKNAYDKENRRYILEHPSAIKFFREYLEEDLTIGKDYDTIPLGYSVKSLSLNKLVDKYTADLKAWLLTEEAKKAYYEAEIETKVKEIWDKYCTGTVSRWEMQSLHYYYHDHELKQVNTKKYNVCHFNDLPEMPVVLETRINKSGAEYSVYDTCCIAGTVTNADNNKHIVTILAHDGTVVDVKFPAFQYIHFNKVISQIGEDGKKTVLDASWFARGNLLLINGFRRELSFIPKTNYDKGQRYSVQLITGIDVSGNLELVSKRVE